MKPYSVAITIAFLAILLAWCWGPVEPVAPPTDAALIALRDSASRARVADSVRLTVRADSIIRLRGDSMATAYARKAASLRPRIIRIPGVAAALQDSPAAPDSAHVAGGDARAVLLGLEACEVDRDAYRGELMVSQASDSAKTKEIARLTDALASKPSGYWRGVRDGAVAGFAGGMLVCGVVD